MECRIWYEKINIIIDNFPIYFQDTFTCNILTNTERWTKTMTTNISTATPLLPTTTTEAVKISTATTPYCRSQHSYTQTTAIDTARIHIWLWRTKRKRNVSINQFLRVYTSYAMNMSTQKPWYFSASRQGRKGIGHYSQQSKYSQGKTNTQTQSRKEKELENTVNTWKYSQEKTNHANIPKSSSRLRKSI